MRQIIGYGLILFAVMLIVGVVPMGLMVCGFLSDSGKLSGRKIIVALSVVVCIVAFEVRLLIGWGWSLIK